MGDVAATGAEIEAWRSDTIAAVLRIPAEHLQAGPRGSRGRCQVPYSTSAS